MASSLAFMVLRGTTKVSTRACGSRKERFARFHCIDLGLNIDLGSVSVPLRSRHPVEPTDDDHEKAEDEQENPEAIGPAIFGKKLKLGKRLSIGHGALR